MATGRRSTEGSDDGVAFEDDVAAVKEAQTNMFGDPPDEDPTKLSFARKTGFGRVTVNFTLEAGLDIGAASKGVEEEMDKLCKALERLDGLLKNRELVERSENSE